MDDFEYRNRLNLNGPGLIPSASTVSAQVVREGSEPFEAKAAVTDDGSISVSFPAGTLEPGDRVRIKANWVEGEFQVARIIQRP